MANNKVRKVKTAAKPMKKVKQPKVSLQVMTGRVIGNKANKTISVLVERKKQHPIYKKAFFRSKKYLVHTEQKLVLGDVVQMVKVKPISKRKHWLVNKVLGRDIEAIVSEELKEQASQAIAEVMPEGEELSQDNNKVITEVKTNGTT